MRTASTIVALLDEAAILQLIEEIKNRPALYNKNIKQYSDMPIKKKLWLEVCEAVIPDWDQLIKLTKTQISVEVLKKWNNLRTCFRREINAQNGAGRKRRRKYVYYDNLQFLLPFTEKKDTKTDIMSFEDEMGPACYVPEGEDGDSDDENDDSNPSTSKPLKSEEQSNQTASDNNTSALVAILEKFKNNDDKSYPFAAAVTAVLDESFIEKLIDTIAKRPGLYDKNKHYIDLHVKKRLWTEVCEEIIPHWHQLDNEAKNQLILEVQKKWSNLRACFRREVKLNNKPKHSLTKRKRRTYVYYDKLSFLLPHIESHSRPCDFKVQIECSKIKCESDPDNSNAEKDNYQEDNPAFYTGACYGENEPEYKLGQSNCQDDDSINEDSDNSEPSTTKRNTQPEQQKDHDQKDQSTTEMNFKTAEFNVSLFKALLERMESGSQDKHFALSLVPMLQDMTPEENLLAKINILKVFKDIRAARRTSNGVTPNVTLQE